MPELALWRRTDGVALFAGMRTDGRPVVDLRDKAGKVRSVYALNADDLPMLQLNDAEERPRGLAIVKADDSRQAHASEQGPKAAASPLGSPPKATRAS